MITNAKWKKLKPGVEVDKNGGSDGAGESD
jgi:hypothetical protein